MAGHYPDRVKRLPMFDGRFDARKLSAENVDVLFASYPAGTVIGEHVHVTDNHGVVTRGELILTLNGRDIIVGVGQWYHVPAGEKHSARFDIETDEIEFWFHDHCER